MFKDRDQSNQQLVLSYNPSCPAGNTTQDSKHVCCFKSFIQNLNCILLVFNNINAISTKFQISGHRKGPRPSTNTTSMYEKSTTHVNRTYSRTYWFIYIDSCTDILYYYTQLVLMNCTSVYTTHILTHLLHPYCVQQLSFGCPNSLHHELLHSVPSAINGTVHADSHQCQGRH